MHTWPEPPRREPTSRLAPPQGTGPWSVLSTVRGFEGLDVVSDPFERTPVISVWRCVRVRVTKRSLGKEACDAVQKSVSTLPWISIASVLTWTIWKINPPLEPLLPQAGDGLGAALVKPLVFRPKEAWRVLTTPPVGPPQKKEDAV